MRADRLVATLLLLQTRGQVTAAELALELEVSVKTARRDLEALGVAGLPVYARPGRGGGWSLLGEGRTDLSGLTAAEARALFLVAGPSAAATPEAKAALRKLVRALPQTFRAEAAAASAAIVIDPAGWGRSASEAPPSVKQLEAAVIERRRVRFRYAARLGSESARRADPLGLVRKGLVWYLLAGTEQGLRTFRIDRMRDLEVTEEPSQRPIDFDLAAAWQVIAERTERRRRKVSATVRIDQERLVYLREQFGDDLTELRTLPDGRAEVMIRRAFAEELADELAGWGIDIEVVEPPEVRAILARRGAELVARYAEPHSSGLVIREERA
jgi:predicted DNA-binding transcriptional regulator YafY